MARVMPLEADLCRQRERLASLDLREAGEPRLEPDDAVLPAQCQEPVLAWQGRTRAHEAHIAAEDVDQLRQLIQAPAPQEGSRAGVDVSNRLQIRLGDC